MSKLRFRVVHCSGQDDQFPAEGLNKHGPHMVGWESARYCEYPQELGLQLLDGESTVKQIQILSHHMKIATRIDIYIGTGREYHTAKFVKLGHMSLESNEHTGYKARELKTAYLDDTGSFLKLVLHQCHINRLNHFNQVGIIAINLVGIPGNDAGAKSSPRREGREVKGSHDFASELNLDAGTVARLKLLADAKSRAVETEDYMTAKQIKLVETELKALGKQLAQIDLAKKEAVIQEDYDRAKELKDESDALRDEIESKIREIEIPGVIDNRAIPTHHTHHQPAPLKSARSAQKFASPAAHAPSSAPTNVDDIVVGGQRSQEEYYRPSTPVEDEVLIEGDRPIRPKAGSKYDDPDPELPDEEPIPQEDFPNGRHPLIGVPNYVDLPTPEDLSINAKEISSTHGIAALLGDYIARCLFSKTWSLREAAVYKTRLLFRDELEPEIGIAGCLTALTGVVRVTSDDKIAQVFLIGLGLLDDVVGVLNKSKVPRATAVPLVEPIITLLIDKLADGASRIRDAARSSLQAIAKCGSIGGAVVGNHALRALSAKMKNTWRPILGRLQLLTDLVNAYGIGGASGLSTESVLNYMKTLNAFAHSNGEVRDAARELTVALQKIVGTEPLDTFLLKELRDKQYKEYIAAFSGDNGAAQAKELPSAAAEKKSSKGSKQQPSHSPPSKTQQSGPTSAAKDTVGDEHDDFTVCMFCGKSDKTWNEDGLDLHYWKECPLLSPCPACAQIVEIAGLPEHLLDECEHKDSYEPCEVTGLAIRRDEMAIWQNGPNCAPPPDNCMYCPLCLASVEDSDEAWRQHLLHGCPQNGRRPA